MLLPALAVTLFLMQFGDGPPRPLSHRLRAVPAAAVPANLNAIPDGGRLASDAGTQVVTGTVTFQGAPVAGAIVTATVEEGTSLIRDRVPCFRSFGPRTEVCDCTASAAEWAAVFQRRTGEGRPVARTRTDADGGFTLAGLPAGAEVWVDAPDAAPQKASPGPVALTKGFWLEADVLDESRQPIAGALVTLPHWTHRFFDAVSDAKGHFKLGPLPELPGEVLVRRAGYLARWGSVHGSVVLRDPHTLRVAIRDDEGPVGAGFPVELTTGSCTTTVTTDARGEAVIRGLGPREYTLRAGDGGYESRKVTLADDENERTLAPFVLRRAVPEPPLEERGPTTRVKLQLLQPNGRPVRVDEAYVKWWGTEFGERVEDVDLPAGEYTFEAHWKHHIGRAQLKVPQQKAVTVKLQPSPKATGRVLDEKGRPLPGMEVSAWCGRPHVAVARTDDAGAFTLWPLDLEDCELSTVLTVPDGGTRSATRPIQFELGKPNRPLVLKLPALATTRARLVDPRGAPVGGAKLSLGSASASVEAVTASDGTFEAALPLGPNSVEVTSEPWCCRAVGTLDGGTTGSTLTARLPPRVSGRVVDAAGRVVTGFEVNGKPVANREGRFEVEAKGTLELFSVDAGRLLIDLADEDQDLGDLALGFPRIAALVVRGPDGGAFPAAMLVEGDEPHDGCPTRHGGLTDAHGRGWVELQSWQGAMVAAPGLPWAILPAPLGAGPHEVRLEAGTATLSGKLTRRGKPVRGIVCVSGASGERSVFTDAAGKWTLDGLRPGPHRVQLYDYRTYEYRDVEVRAGATVFGSEMQPQ